jgi:hypothetical protein
MRRRVELGFRLLALAVVVAAALGCQSPERTGSLVDWFMSATNDPDVQAEGSISGSIVATLGHPRVASGEYSGSFRYVGKDCAYSIRLQRLSVASEEESVSLGQWTYLREERGPWVRSARATRCPLANIEAAGGLVDRGLGNHFDRALYRLDVKDPAAMATAVGMDSDDLSSSPWDLTFSFWAEADGTPAGMSLEGGREEETEDGTVVWSLAIDWAFETRSGVAIEIPEAATEPSTKPYAHAAGLHDRLASIAPVDGRVYGTYTVGDESSRVSGSVRISGGNTEIHINAGPNAKPTWSEIVVGGNRYVSRDDTVWVNRGKKGTPTILDVLAAAPTDNDAGVQAVGGKAFRAIVSPADTLDVASALGIDMVNVKGPGTRFRVWVDSSGEPVGFGGTLQWGKIVDGSPTAFELEVDVLFESPKETAIVAPKNPWKWIVDEKEGVAFGLPASLSLKGSTDLGEGTKAPTYLDAKKTFIFFYANLGAPGEGWTAERIMDELANSLGYSIETRYEADVDGQSAESALGHDSGYFIIMTLAVTDSSGYEFVFGGSNAKSSQRKATELLCDQILATVQLLR